MRRLRVLSAQEAELWHRLTSGVTPLRPAAIAAPVTADRSPAAATAQPAAAQPAAPSTAARSAVAAPVTRGASPAPLHRPAAGATAAAPGGLDGSWERKLARGLIEPDFTLDLHGATLERAYARLDAGFAQARMLGARVVLLIAGRPRPTAAADRGHARGAIRAKLGDWIAAGPYAAAIAAIRPAHRRHGGAGALYVVLRRPR